MSKQNISLEEFNGFEPEVEIASSYSYKLGSQKKIVAIISLQSNQVCYKVGNTEKAWLKSTLKDAIDTYNTL